MATESPSAIPISRAEISLFETIFLPHLGERTAERYNNAERQARYAHYTSAEAALKIIGSKQLWMRNTTCMSDYREILHGYEMLRNHFADPTRRNAFVTALNRYAPGAAGAALQRFDSWWLDRTLSPQFNTYVTSISEHLETENDRGRLSMWRGFGTSARVALVFRLPERADGALERLNTVFAPVAYWSAKELAIEIERVVRNFSSKSDLLTSLRPDLLGLMVLSMLLTHVACLKHKGFEEEREWRAVYISSIGAPNLMKSAIEIVGGAPQPVYKLPLDEKVSPEIKEIDFLKIFDRLIVGPSQCPRVIHDAFVTVLTQAGVADAADRVVVSDIPIRS